MTEMREIKFRKSKDVYGNYEEKETSKKNPSQKIIYEGVLKAGKHMLGRKIKGETTPVGLKMPKEEDELLRDTFRKKFKKPEEIKEIVKEEKRLEEIVDALIDKGKDQEAVKKGRELAGLIQLITMGKDLAARAFRKKLEKFLKEKKPKTEIKQIWLKLITPTKELYLEEITEKTKKEQKPQFLEKLEKSNEIKEKPKIEKKPDKSKAHKELKKISKHLTKKQEKEVKKWIETISEIQRIKEIKNYYRPLLTFLQKKYG